MKSVYQVRMPKGIKPAIADVSMQGTGLYLIHRINVPEAFRGEGFGTRILNCILQDADREQATLVLEVFASGPLSTDALVAWYRRHGFRMVNYMSRLMERKPGGDNNIFHDRTRQANWVIPISDED